jgi:ribonuclease BN (tRNA processing enzyme)
VARTKRLVPSHLSPGAKALPDSRRKAQAQAGYDVTVHVGNDLEVISL